MGCFGGSKIGSRELGMTGWVNGLERQTHMLRMEYYRFWPNILCTWSLGVHGAHITSQPLIFDPTVTSPILSFYQITPSTSPWSSLNIWWTPHPQLPVLRILLWPPPPLCSSCSRGGLGLELAAAVAREAARLCCNNLLSLHQAPETKMLVCGCWTRRRKSAPGSWTPSRSRSPAPATSPSWRQGPHRVWTRRQGAPSGRELELQPASPTGRTQWRRRLDQNMNGSYRELGGFSPNI
jgi:hypothetical protein